MMGTDLALSRAVTGTWPRPGDQGPSLHQTEDPSQPQTAGAEMGRMVLPPLLSSLQLSPGDWHSTLKPQLPMLHKPGEICPDYELSVHAELLTVHVYFPPGSPTCTGIGTQPEIKYSKKVAARIPSGSPKKFCVKNVNSVSVCVEGGCIELALKTISQSSRGGERKGGIVGGWSELTQIFVTKRM